jgi:hypothetical protein
MPRLLVLLATAAAALAIPLAEAAAATSTSSNWAGYAVSSADPTAPATYTSVSGTWVQPAANCSASNAAFSAFWVGLGGFAETSQGLEQIGTESDSPLVVARPTASGTSSCLPRPFRSSSRSFRAT